MGGGVGALAPALVVKFFVFFRPPVFLLFCRPPRERERERLCAVFSSVVVISFFPSILDPSFFQRHGKILGMDHKVSFCLIIIFTFFAGRGPGAGVTRQ